MMHAAYGTYSSRLCDQCVMNDECKERRNVMKTLTATQKQRVGRPFPPGVSGNPAGRPHDKEANRLLAAVWDEVVRGETTRGEHLIRRLFALADHSNPNVALRAIEQILDRRLGKPVQVESVLLERLEKIEEVANARQSESN
jgi:hypothetical protein